LTWIKPPWRDEDRDKSPDSEGQWPWCGDVFLAAVPIVQRFTGKESWEFHVLHWDEDGLQDANDESWGAWSESDIEWIARIPEPPGDGTNG
jgi:hypothetical protein